ncbi:MAG: ATP-binding cassette domain-containing protein, partial [Actinobacteria bacterium]|nr:ATP-binding cassette domain-containing protein [Actinomycetota bacterium]
NIKILKINMLNEIIDSNQILKLIDLKMYFQVGRGFLGHNGVLKAVDGVTFSINKGDTFGLVGESGSGKTTLGKCILGLYDITSGKIIFNGEEISKLNSTEFLKIRRKIQLIFQDPLASLNPRLKVKELIAEPLKLQKIKLSNTELDKSIDKVLNDVNIDLRYRNRFPHEFSGGQQQRICIARALILNPSFIVCDEPIASLDVSIQAQIINLLNDLQEEYKLTYLFISHDLSIVKFISNRIGIMYLGKIVELGNSDKIFSDPAHPYSKSLLSATPILDPNIKKKRILLKGEIASPFDVPTGCKFHTRCNCILNETCENNEPELIKIDEDHYVACHSFKET